MLKSLSGLITVRTSSSRLPNKCLLPFGDGNVLEHVIRRALASGIDPIVCTSVDRSDDIIEKIATNEGVKFFRGSLTNKLKRWSDCAANFGLETFHTVDADDPFFDGEEMRVSMLLLSESRVDMVCPSKVSSAGGGSVGYSLTTDVVRRASADLAAETDTEMMWFYLEKLPDLRSLVLPDNPLTPPKLRLTLDYEEDYWLLESVRRIVGNLAARDVIDHLFIKNLDLYKVNWFRNDEWKSAQFAKRI
jgi:spore coat polysaccharide biosynthesis protein SpsF